MNVRTEFPGRARMLQPGQHGSLILQCALPIPLEEGARFILRSDSTTIALGVVSK